MSFLHFYCILKLSLASWGKLAMEGDSQINNQKVFYTGFPSVATP